jgi:hypothetical protein
MRENNRGQQMKNKPTGFVATCQCGEVVGALDYMRTDRKESGKILGGWIADGCTIAPRFTGDWRVHVTGCKCGS